MEIYVWIFACFICVLSFWGFINKYLNYKYLKKIKNLNVLYFSNRVMFDITKFWENLNPYQFEDAVSQLLLFSGLNTTLTKKSKDNGIDIKIFKKNKLFSIVQCKYYSKPIYVEQMREFIGTMKVHNIKYGIFATNSSYSNGCIDLAKINNVVLMDKETLISLSFKVDFLNRYVRSKGY